MQKENQKQKDKIYESSSEESSSEDEWSSSEEEILYDQEEIEKFKTTCMNMNLKSDKKFQDFKLFYNYCKEEALDMLTRFSDCLRFLKRDNERSNLAGTLRFISTWSEIPSIRRMVIATTLYNQGFIDICYECFDSFIDDEEINIEHKVEACKYLYSSGKSEYSEKVQEYLIDVIKNNTLASEYKYRIITSFSNKYGVKSMFNSTKLFVDYDEKFIYLLQLSFFENENNDVHHRMLSAQYILNMELPSKDEKEAVIKKLFEIMLDEKQTENYRAIACDIIVRCGSMENAQEADAMIRKLGRKRDGKFSNVETLYSNSQNAHEKAFAVAVDLFVERYFGDSNEFVKSKDHDKIYEETISAIKRYHSLPKDKLNSIRALNTLSLDSATFTKYKVSIVEVYDKVWSIISLYEKDKKDEYEKRIVTELLDMCEICATGLIGRIVNILSLETGDVKISYEDQIVSNVAGRIQARIRHIEDESLQESIVLATMVNPEDEHVSKFKNFILSIEGPLKRELYTEFVDCEFVSKEEFEKSFERGMHDWKKIFSGSQQITA